MLLRLLRCEVERTSERLLCGAVLTVADLVLVLPVPEPDLTALLLRPLVVTLAPVLADDAVER